MPKYLEENSTDEPYVLAHGSVNIPHQVFVVSKGKALEKPNLLMAVDTCFKLFYVYRYRISLAMWHHLGISSESYF